MKGENEALAVWAGLECRCEPHSYRIMGIEIEKSIYYGNCPRHSNGGNPPDYDRDEVAMVLLPELHRQGYEWEMHGNEDGSCDCIVSRQEDDGCVTWIMGDDKPTIAAAIKAACLQLVEKESL